MWTGLLGTLSLLLFIRLTEEQQGRSRYKKESLQWFESMLVETERRQQVEKEKEELTLEVCELQRQNKELLERLHKQEGDK